MKLRQSFVDVFTNPLLLSASVLLDALFFFMFAFVTTPIGDVLTSHAVLFFTSAVSAWKIFALIFLMYIAGFVVYVSFQGPAWWVAKRIAGEKAGFCKYFLRFVKVNLVWLVLIAINGVLDLFASLNESIGEGSIVWAIVLKVFLWAIAALAILSYPNAGLKGMFSPGWKKIAFFLVSAFIMFHLAYFIPIPFYGVSELLGKIVAAILMAPMLTIIRVFAVNELK